MILKMLSSESLKALLGRAPAVLESKALGSCLGVAIYDYVAHSAGLSMLCCRERSVARSSVDHKEFKVQSIPALGVS